MGFRLPFGSNTGGTRVPVQFRAVTYTSLASLQTDSQNNPAELFNSNTQYSTAIVEGDTDPTLDGKYSYDGANGVYSAEGWVLSENLSGADRATLDSIQGLTSGTLPIAGTGELMDSPLVMDTVRNVIEASVPLKLPGGGALEFDNNDMSSGGTVSGGAAGVRFNNNSDDTSGYLVSVPFETVSGSGTPFFDKFGPEISAPSISDRSDPRNSQFDFINPLPGIVTEYTVSRPSGSPTLTGCNFIIWLEGYEVGNPLFDFKDSSPTGEGFTLVAGDNVVVPPVPIGFPANINDAAPANEQIRLYSRVLDSEGNLVELDGSVIDIPSAINPITGLPDPRSEQQWLPYLERKVHFSTRTELVESGVIPQVDHPVTLRRDMPSEADSQALSASSLNGNSALWSISNDQLSTSNRAEATIAAQIEGLLDADGNEIPTTATAANNVRLRIGSEVRVFSANEFRVITSPILDSDILSKTDPLQDAVTALQRTAFNSGRAFIRFNDGFNVGDAGFEAATVRNKNLIYTAKNQKAITSPTRPDIILPNETEILGAGGYPYTFEVTHIGGTGFSTTENLVRLFSADGLTLLQTLLFDQVAVLFKPTASDPWEISTSPFDASSFVLASGVVNLLDTEIQSASQITTELNGVTISKGDALVVNTGGEWGQYTGGSEIPDHSILMALVDGPSILDVDTNTDWFLFTNGLLDTRATALVSNFEQDGIKFTGNRNIRVDPSNVAEFMSQATGTPAVRQIGSNTQGAGRRQSYANTNIQFSDLIGGSLTVNLRIDVTRVTGFSPAFTAFELEYPNGVIFTFPLGRVDGDNSLLTSTIQIPNSDYSAILNQNPTLQSLYYDFFGELFLGEYTVESIVNTSVGELNQSVALVASQQVDVLRQETAGNLARLTDEIDADGSALNALTPRISNIRSETVSEPDVNARFLDSTGSDAFPSTIASMNQVSAANPRFTGGNVAMYVAAEGGAVYGLNNITKSTSIPLNSSEATVDLGESLVYEGTTYFVYRVTGLTSGEVYEVDKITSENVYAWPTDIQRNHDAIARIDAELEHAILNLDDEVVQVFENSVSVEEETTPTVVPSEYNLHLAGISNTTQTTFYEPNENTGSGGFRTSQALKDNIGDQARRKLIYFARGQTFANQAYVHAFDGTTSRDLIRYTDGVFNAQVFVPAIPSGTTTSTVYPAPSNKVSGNGIWINVPTLTFINGIPTQEADEVFFTRNVPSQSSTLNIAYRGHANGNVFGTSSTTLTGVGGSSEVATSFTLDSGSEQAFVEVRYYPSSREIRVSVTESVNSGLPTINDIEVILSYDETRNVPATPATVREVEIDRAGTRPYVFAIKPSTSGNLILVGREREIDTGYAYTTLFGASEDGHLAVVNEASRFLNYEDFEPIASTILDLENHATLPQFGLFTTEYKEDTLLQFGVTLEPAGFSVNALPTSDIGLASGMLWWDGDNLQVSK